MQEPYRRNNNVVTFEISAKHFLIVSSFGNVLTPLIWLRCNEAYCSFDSFPFSGIKVNLPCLLLTSRLPQQSWHFDCLICLALFAFSLKVTPKLLLKHANHYMHSPPLTLDGYDKAEGLAKRVQTGVNMGVILRFCFFRPPSIFALSSNYLAVSHILTQLNPPSFFLSPRRKTDCHTQPGRQRWAAEQLSRRCQWFLVQWYLNDTNDETNTFLTFWRSEVLFLKAIYHHL